MEDAYTPPKPQDPNALSLAQFADSLRQSGRIRRILELAYEEDLGSPPQDWTGQWMLSPDDRRTVEMRSREIGIVGGLEFLPDLVEIFSQPGQIAWEALAKDGQAIEPGTVLARFEGNAQAVVQLERTMLNLIARLSGIATRTNQFVKLVEGTKAKVCDTRKTTPGLRAFEKYAVRCGGGTTHRMGLYDAVLIKDNHISDLKNEDLATKIAQGAYKVGHQDARLWFVQVEVDTLDQLTRVLEIEPGVVSIVLLDNMGPGELCKAVALRDASFSKVLLEASGGVSAETVGQIAQTGVDRISIGGLTHQATSLDIGLDACS